MQVCRARGVDCIVAPYEADAQLAYLNKAGIAQIIITEDSDLLLFGCEKVSQTKTYLSQISKSTFLKISSTKLYHFSFCGAFNLLKCMKYIIQCYADFVALALHIYM